MGFDKVIRCCDLITNQNEMTSPLHDLYRNIFVSLSFMSFAFFLLWFSFISLVVITKVFENKANQMWTNFCVHLTESIFILRMRNSNFQHQWIGIIQFPQENFYSIKIVRINFSLMLMKIGTKNMRYWR